MSFHALIKDADTFKHFDRGGDGMLEANSVVNRRAKARRSMKRCASKAVRRNQRDKIKQELADLS